MRQYLKRLLPNAAIDAIRRARKTYRHLRWKYAVRDKSILDKESLVHHFAELGIESGRDLIVHGSLSRLGFVQGGAPAVIEALLEVVGDGNLLMPVYPMKGTMLETMQDPTPFDVSADPSSMGKISETFRLLPGVQRSAHPTHSVAVKGPQAELYVSRHHTCRSPCAPGSPFAILSQRHGAILTLGTGVGKVTSHHVIEDQVDFPLAVYLPQAYAKEVIFPDGRRERVEVLVHDPKYSALRIDSIREVEEMVLRAMNARRMITEKQIGNAQVHLFGAHQLDELLLELLREGKTIYQVAL